MVVEEFQSQKMQFLVEKAMRKANSVIFLDNCNVPRFWPKAVSLFYKQKDFEPRISE